MAEGVGFEPTVSCPTFDFESSALNRAQPPFRRPYLRRGGGDVKAGIGGEGRFMEGGWACEGGVAVPEVEDGLEQFGDLFYLWG